MLINSSLSRLAVRRLSSGSVWPVIIKGRQSEGPAFAQKRHNHRNYDKPRRLLPERIEYKYKDSKFFEEHRLEDEPYLKLTDEEVCDLSKVKLEKDYPNRHTGERVDINEEPFRQVLVGNEDQKGFTGVETLLDKNRWFWVKRLFPKPEIPESATDEPVVYPSGWRPPRLTKPDLPYFIGRTRTKLYPVYRRYQIEGRNQQEYWKNRWDGLFNHWHRDLLERLDETKFENNETTLTLTLIQQIQGDIWQFEEDIRGQLEVKHQKRILSAINEPNGVLTLKGDFVDECVLWLSKRGF